MLAGITVPVRFANVRTSAASGDLQNQLTVHGRRETVAAIGSDDETPGSANNRVSERLFDVVAYRPSAAIAAA